MFVAFKETGSSILFTGFTLAIGVSLWVFSDLKFQADMGLLLTFMFLVNMLGALLLLPAMARWLYHHHTRKHANRTPHRRRGRDRSPGARPALARSPRCRRAGTSILPSDRALYCGA